MKARTAQPADAAAIAHINVAAWEATYRGFVDDGALDRTLSSDLELAWRQEIESPSNSGSRVIVVEHDDRVVGYARFGPSEEDDASASTGAVYGLYVHPLHWGTGAGRFLFERVQEELRANGTTEATLWVTAENHRAKRFYEINGWYYDGRDDMPFLGSGQLRYRKQL